MTDPESLPADVFLDAQVPAVQERLLLDALSACGVTGRAKVVPTRRSLDQLHWLVLVALPLHAFLGAIGSKLAEDAYQGLKTVVRGLLHAEGPSARGRRPMVFQDSATGLQVVLEPGLPDEAYQQLLSLDLSKFQLGPVHYDPAQHRWRSELDEARS